MHFDFYFPVYNYFGLTHIMSSQKTVQPAIGREGYQLGVRDGTNYGWVRIPTMGEGGDQLRVREGTR